MLSSHPLKVGAWIAAAAITLLAAVSVGFEIFGPAAPRAVADPEASSGGVLLVSVQAVVESAFAVLGAVVVTRQPRNPVGWLLMLVGLAFMVIGISNQLYLQVVLPSDDRTGIVTYVLWAGSWSWLPGMAPAFVFLPLLFPTGRPLSPRWRLLVWISAAALALAIFGAAFKSGRLDGAPAVVNPLGIDHPALAVVEQVGIMTFLLAALASIASLVVRFRRSRGVERQQLKWVATAAVLLPVAATGSGFGGAASWPLILIALLIVAAAMAVAMLRYRLYDIDLVINRALVYAGLTATLAATYVGSVLLLQLTLGPLADRSDLTIAGSTLAVAALFRPARDRIQALVDRRFFRGRYDAARTLDVFGKRLREQVNLETVGADLRAVIDQTVQPAHVSLWLKGH